MQKIILLFIIVSCFTAACSSIETTPKETDIQQSIAEKKTPELPPLKQTCLQIKENINASNFTAMAEIFHQELFINKVMIGVNNNLPAFEKLKNEFTVALQTPENYISRFFSGVSNQWQIIRYNEDKNSAKCLLRSDMDDSGVSIVEFYLHEIDGKAFITNFYDHMQGILLSESFSTIINDYEDIYVRLNEANYSKLSFAYKDFINLTDFLKSTNENDPTGVIIGYAKLSEEYKNEYIYALKYLNFSKSVGSQTYTIALKNLEKRFGSDADHGMALMDYYYENKNYEKVFTILDALENKIGSNATIDMMRAITYKDQGNHNLFYKHCLLAIENDPSIEYSYWLLLKDFIDKNQTEDALLVLDILKIGFHYDFTKNTFKDDANFSNLTRSSAYKQWLEN